MLKKIIYIQCIIFIPLISIIFYLYYHEKILFLFDTKIEKSIKKMIYSEKVLLGIFFDNNKKITIPIKIGDDLFDQKSPELFLYEGLYQFFHYLNLEGNAKYIFFLNHVVIQGKQAIINMSINKKKELTSIEEISILKSIYQTTKNILPYIDNVYLYDEDTELQFDTILPFLENKLYQENSLKVIEEYSNKSFVTVIPLLKNNGNKIDDIFEKNIFQNVDYSVYLPKNYFYDENWSKEINQLNCQNANQFFYFINIFYSDTPSLRIYLYPFFSDDDYVLEIENFPTIKNNYAINKQIEIIKKKIDSKIFLSIEYMPLKCIISSTYPSLYLVVSGPNKKEIDNIINMII